MVPPLREMAKENIPLAETEKLLGSQYHEARMLAVHRMRRLYATSKRDPDGRAALVRMLLANLHRLNNWDLVDVCCPFILGDYIATTVYGGKPVPLPPPASQLSPLPVAFDAPLHVGRGGAKVKVARVACALEPTVETLARLIQIPTAAADTRDIHGYDTTLFLRRVGIVTALGWANQAESGPSAVALAESTLADHHDLMHKPAGWVLREAWKGAPPLMHASLARHCGTMSRTALRYAIVHLPEGQRKAYLAGTPPPGVSTKALPAAKKSRVEASEV
jgi:3-methyladenine DNA glycosylase AlkD